MDDELPLIQCRGGGARGRIGLVPDLRHKYRNRQHEKKENQNEDGICFASPIAVPTFPGMSQKTKARVRVYVISCDVKMGVETQTKWSPIEGRKDENVATREVETRSGVSAEGKGMNNEGNRNELQGYLCFAMMCSGTECACKCEMLWRVQVVKVLKSILKLVVRLPQSTFYTTGRARAGAFSFAVSISVSLSLDIPATSCHGTSSSTPLPRSLRPLFSPQAILNQVLAGYNHNLDFQ
jgi:hypothetical protein